MSVEITDTSERTREMYFRRLKEMTPSERLAVGVALCAAGNALQWAAMRRRHPGASEDEITFKIAASQWGTEVAGKVYKKAS